MQKALTGQHTVYDWTTGTPGGDRFYQTSLSPVIGENGVITEVVGVGRDVTELVLAERAHRQADAMIAEREELYHSLVSALAEGIVMQDARGEILTCNRAAEHVLGLTFDQMSGRTSLDPRWKAIHEDGSAFPGETHPAMVTLATGEPQQNIIMGVQKPTGLLSWISINSYPIYKAQDPHPVAVVASFTDITQRKKLDEAILKVSGNLGEKFMDTLAMQLATILEADCTFIGQLQQPANGQEIIETQAICLDGVIIDKMVYSLSDTPCEMALKNGVYVHEKAVTQHFPKSVWLIKNGLEGYVGIQVVDSKNKPVGLISVLYRKPVPDSRTAVAILQLFATRTAAELTRKQYEDALKNTLDDLEKRVQERTQELNLANHLLEMEVSYRKRAEDSIRAMLEAVPDAIILTNESGIIGLVNSQAEQLFGYNRTELLGSPIEILIPARFHKRHQHQLQNFKILAQPRPMGSGTEIYGLHKSGREIPLDISLSPLKTGVDIQIISAIHDISDQRRIEMELRQAKEAAEAANRAKSEFLANMSHELRTPLNAILGYAQILKAHDSLTHHQREGLSIIESSGEHLLTLINDILDLSKIEAGRLDLDQTSFELVPLLQRLTATVAVRAKAKDISFSFEIVGEIPRFVSGDERKLRQILINLLGNAIKFTDKGGVALKVGRHFGKIRFQVEDTGIGIPADKLDKIFSPFYQVKMPSAYIEGTGLGLAISQRLAILMGAELQVESKEFQGSRFWFDLDLPEADAIETAPADTPKIIGYRGQRQTILVADDKIENRTLLITLLSPLGFEVGEAQTGPEAVQTALKLKPNLIFMDIRMPELSGLDAIRHIRRHAFDTPIHIVAISASAFEHNRLECLMAGADDFIAKPFKINQILEAAGRLLQLNWIYDRFSRPLPDAFESNLKQFKLPKEDLDRFKELAAIGNIKRIIALARQIEARASNFEPLTQAIIKSAREFNTATIMDWITILEQNL